MAAGCQGRGGARRVGALTVLGWFSCTTAESGSGSVKLYVHPSDAAPVPNVDDSPYAPM